jgi:hypothetical protein
MKALRVCLLLALAGMFSSGIRADEILQISGTAVTVGNATSNCKPSPCTIVSNFSFDLDIIPYGDESSVYLPEPVNGGSYTVLSSLGNSSGPFRASADGLTQFSAFGTPENYVALPGFPDEVDMDFGLTVNAEGVAVLDETPGYSPVLSWYTCLSQTCIQDFILPQYQSRGGCRDFGCVGETSSLELLNVTSTQVQAAEPSSLEFIECGFLLALAVFGVSRLGFRFG